MEVSAGILVPIQLVKILIVLHLIRFLVTALCVILLQKNHLLFVPSLPLRYAPPPKLQSTCHYTVNHYVKLWDVRLWGAK